LTAATSFRSRHRCPGSAGRDSANRDSARASSSLTSPRREREKARLLFLIISHEGRGVGHSVTRYLFHALRKALPRYALRIPRTTTALRRGSSRPGYSALDTQPSRLNTFRMRALAAVAVFLVVVASAAAFTRPPSLLVYSGPRPFIVLGRHFYPQERV